MTTNHRESPFEHRPKTAYRLQPNADGTIDRGRWQIINSIHTQYNHDSLVNDAWTTYKNGAKQLSDDSAALA